MNIYVVWFWCGMHYNLRICEWNGGTKPFWVFIIIEWGFGYHSWDVLSNYAIWEVQWCLHCVSWFNWCNGLNEIEYIANWYDFGIGLVHCVREQTRNPASFAQAGPPRLSENCRVSRWALICGSRLGDPREVWATWFLAQARGTRLSEVARRTWKFYAWYLAQARCFEFWAIDTLA